ncbi:hypothetical protein [Massilia genomosp. 1]|uniref:Uncharacterized protein n=1 Tax=Massilia genomosp. 1 TaxID=2609280 RepID=A0ABX0MT32_9BURK|nr:hypothetical protein [Massilia genomosp. 1]NHZ65591.1 hypothetical protein [Massilia genomosp. 1]
MTLAPQLAPWRAWLALLAPGLVEPLGQMLLHLQPLVGAMRGPGAGGESTPVGAGSIARRGPCNRLLISERAVADAAPDELPRRAGELLLSAPEPGVPHGARLCVALFDTGPAQLGEPRLVRMALFILPAQRAQQAGADCRWGVLQDPCALRGGPGSLRAWLDARTVTCIGPAHINEWNAALAALGDAVEVWQIGARALPDSPALQVTITHQQRSRTLTLALPAAHAGADLLRKPFARAAAPHGRRRGADGMSLTEAPRFGLQGDWIVAFMQQDGATLHHLPGDPSRARHKPRRLYDKPDQVRLGAILIDRALAEVESRDGTLLFARFPGKLFGPLRTAPLPPPAQFALPEPGHGLLPTFFLSDQAPGWAGTRVFMLDRAGQLGCWKVTGQDPDASVRFDQVADNVVAAAQRPDMLVYARSVGHFTTIHVIDEADKFPTAVADFPCAARRVLFGMAQQGTQRRAHRGWMLAIETSERHWLLVADCAMPGATPIALDVTDGAMVVGVTRSGPRKDAAPALLVLCADRCTVELRSAGATVAVLHSEASIAQLAFDNASSPLCWVTDQQELFARALHGDDIVPHVPVAGVTDAG